VAQAVVLARSRAGAFPSDCLGGRDGFDLGTVRSADGGALPGARVTISGPLLPAGRSVTAATDGAFGFQRLPPGTYQVNATLEGMGSARREAIVASLGPSWAGRAS
jgi:hypothetical protein